MRRGWVSAIWLTGAALLLGGCATIRTTDPPRTATEQFLMSQAIARAVEQLSAVPLRDKVVFVDASFMQVTDQLYVVGEVRAKLLVDGVRLVSKREEAKIVLEVRSGGVGIDRHDYLVGLPSIPVPFTTSQAAGVPLVTPELAVYKNQRQRGFASVAFVAYWANTGELVASSGPFIGRTIREDYWFFGFGPRTVGNIPTTERPR